MRRKIGCALPKPTIHQDCAALERRDGELGDLDPIQTIPCWLAPSDPVEPKMENVKSSLTKLTSWRTLGGLKVKVATIICS